MNIEVKLSLIESKLIKKEKQKIEWYIFHHCRNKQTKKRSRKRKRKQLFTYFPIFDSPHLQRNSLSVDDNIYTYFFFLLFSYTYYLPGFCWAFWHSCWMGYRNQWQIRGRKAPKFGWATFGWVSCNLCSLCIALDLAF